MSIEAVVFDLDGTLLDSLADIATAANVVLDAHGLPTHELDAYRYFVGSGVRHLLDRTLPEPYRSDEQLAGQLIAEFLEQYRQTCNVQTRLYDGITEMLDALVQRQLALAVLSNKPQAATSQCVDYYLSGYPFVAVLGQSPTRPPKPDLTGIREILARLQVAPENALYLGDTAIDMQTAGGAGMPAVGVTWGFRDRDELIAAGAQRLIDHPAELLPLLDDRA